jgi:hypothetical protein
MLDLIPVFAMFRALSSGVFMLITLHRFCHAISRRVSHKARLAARYNLQKNCSKLDLILAELGICSHLLVLCTCWTLNS